MQTILSVIVGIIIFLVVLKIVGKVVKAVCFAFLCAGAYWCLTHTEQVAFAIESLKGMIGGN